MNGGACAEDQNPVRVFLVLRTEACGPGIGGGGGGGGYHPPLSPRLIERPLELWRQKLSSGTGTIVKFGPLFAVYSPYLALL